MKKNKIIKVFFVVNDANEEFEVLYRKIYPDSNWLTLNDQQINICGVEVNGGVVYSDENIYLKQCSFCNINISEDCGNKLINDIKEYCQRNLANGRIINNVFIKVQNQGLDSNQMSLLTKKYSADDSNTSGVNFYNFGKCYILNKTFFDSDYSVFGNNIAHEAINIFKTDAGNRYFYLCKDGKLNNNYLYDENNIKKLPINYTKLEKAELINYSKVSECEKATYIMLQKVSNLKIVDVAFDKERDESKYEGINYNNVNICDIFRLNSFLRKNKTTGKFEDVTENYPYVTFLVESENDVKKPTSVKTFPTRDENNHVAAEFANLASSSCRQFVIEGTNLFNAIERLIGNDDNEWTSDVANTLGDYITSSNFEDDYEENSLLKIINEETKETYFSKLLTFVFANSKEILQKYCSINDIAFPEIKAITNIYNEEKNMDISLTFIDSNDDEYFLVIENKIHAPFTPEGTKQLQDYFSAGKYQKIVESVNDEFESYKVGNANKQYNQLTKYHLIASVIAKDLGIDSQNVKYLILAPEYKQDYYDNEKLNYYYGNDYQVTSYKSIKEAIEEVKNDQNADFQNLLEDLKDIIIQVSRSIWPYTSDSYTYYKRTMTNRFARSAKKLHDANESNHS